jgi:hypothetical protein
MAIHMAPDGQYDVHFERIDDNGDVQGIHMPVVAFNDDATTLVPGELGLVVPDDFPGSMSVCSSMQARIRAPARAA